MWVMQGNAVTVELDLRRFQADLVHVRRAADGGQHILELLGFFHAGVIAAGQQDAAAVWRFCHVRDLGHETDIEFARQHGIRLAQHQRVRQLRDFIAARKQGHAHAQAGQRLAQLQADDAAADHGHRAGQIRPLEHGVAGDEALARRLPLGRHDRRGTGGDHHAGGLDDRMLIHLQLAWADEARMAAQFFFVGNRIDAVEHEADKAVALAAHPGHHLPAIDAHGARMHAETGRGSYRMGRLGRRDQEFAGHAAHPGAGRAVRSAFYHQHALVMHARRPVRRHAGRAAADHGHIHLYRLHGAVHPLRLLTAFDTTRLLKIRFYFAAIYALV